MMRNYIQHLLVFIASCVFIIGCDQSKKNTADTSSDPDFEQPAVVEEVEKAFNYPVPTAYEVASLLNEVGATYVSDITNPTSNVENYVTQFQRATNLGVYGADLSYASTYGQGQATVDFLDASRQLINDLSIQTAFNSDMANRVESNLENKDSIITIVTESFYDTYQYLNANGQEKTSLLVIAGSVIEGLYITCELIVSSDYNEKFMSVLAKQKETVKKSVEILENYSDDKNVIRILPKLRFISIVYDQLGDNGEMTKGQFGDIYRSVKEMRSEIVG